MTERRWHLTRQKLQPVSPWYFLVAFIIFSTMSVIALHNNSVTAIKLSQALVKADEQNGDVETALRKLRQYMYSHMNTGFSDSSSIKQPIQLKFRYERLVAAEKARVDALNAKIYPDAQAFCEQQFPHGLSGGGRVPCIQQYVLDHGAKEQPIPDALYKFDFVSPTWSPDLAGWSLVLAVLSLILFGGRFVLERRLQAQLNT